MMEKIKLDETMLLDPTKIPIRTLNRLMAFLNRSPASYAFQCTTCGKTRRDSKIIDPGRLHFGHTCARAKRSCADPEDPSSAGPPEYVPGSLVFVVQRGMFWPSLVEYSSDILSDYCLRRERGASPFAYFITFVGIDTSRTFGGWFTLQNISPLLRYPVERVRDPLLQKALTVCNEVHSLSLRERLLRLSFTAGPLRLSGYTIKDFPTDREVIASP